MNEKTAVQPAMLDEGLRGHVQKTSEVAIGLDRSLDVVSFGSQRIMEDCVGAAVYEQLEFDGARHTTEISFRSIASVVQFLRYLSGTTADYVAFSLRSGIIWDRELPRRITREVAELDRLNIPWLLTTADGADIRDARYSSAHFDREPSLTPDRGRRAVVQTNGTLVVLNMAKFRTLTPHLALNHDLKTLVNDLIVIGYLKGLASIYSAGMYPCIFETRNLSYSLVSDLLYSRRIQNFVTQQYGIIPGEDGDRTAMFASTVEEIEEGLRENHKFSFVVRTIFTRSHMLNRCLISIDYIRSSLGIPVEVVLATDVEPRMARREMAKIADQFPLINFTLADGKTERGYSRVRNLVAGLKATSGARVCIIDDDDFYTPQAVAYFERACAFGREELVLFDTQIVVERWLDVGLKHQRELLGYRRVHCAKEWPITLGGSNSIPLCGIIHPGWFIRQVAEKYEFAFDLSEDFIFHLYCYTDPHRPDIMAMDGIGAYQSHRESDDNVSTAPDRSRWALDTCNGLHQQIFGEKRNFSVVVRNPVANVPDGAALEKVQNELYQEKDSSMNSTNLAASLVDQIQASNSINKETEEKMTAALAAFVERLDPRAGK